MRRRKRIYPPNCTVCDLNPSRFLAFREKQNRVEAEYGFRLGVPCRTPEQKDGRRRYMRDWQKRYRAAHPDRRAYKNNWCLRKRVEARLGRKPTAEEMAEALAAKEAREALHEERKRIAKEQYGFDLGTVPFEMSPEEAEARKRFRKAEKDKWKAEHPDLMREYHRRSNLKEREKKIRRKISLANLAKAREKQKLEAQRRREEAEEAKRKAILDKYGYDISREPETAEEQQAERRYRQDLKREEREKLAARRKARHDAAVVARRLARAAAKAERDRKREEAEAAMIESQRRAIDAYAAEREANRAAYLAAKAATREERRGKREEKEPPVTLVTPVEPVQQAPAQPVINIADYLPHHPFRSLLLEDTTPTDEELAGEGTSPAWADYVADEEESSVPAAGGGSTPIDPPSNNNTTTGGSEDDDDDWRRREREEKIRRVQEQYGFTLGKKPVTPEEIEGKKRYEKDRNRETAIRNREIDFMLHGKERIRKAAAKKRKATIARKKREAAAQAAREAKVAELAAQAKAREEARQAARVAKQEAIEASAAAKAERKVLLEQAYETFGYKVKAYENKKQNMRRRLGLPEMKRDFTPEQRETWNTYIRESRAELEDWLVERMRKELANVGKRDRGEERQQSVAETLAAREQRKKEREERKRVIFEKYGFTLGKKPVTPEEIEGFKRWQRDREAEYRERHREHITAYNREYRRRRRAEALAKRQTTWTRKQWAAWEKKQASKERGSPQWLVKEVVKHLAAVHGLTEDQVTERLLELGGLDFLIAGAESMGAKHCQSKAMIRAAARALALYLDPDNAEMFGEREEKRTESDKGDKEQQSKENAS